MGDVEARVPIRLRLRGSPTAADLARLEESVARLVAGRVEQARRALDALRQAAVAEAWHTHASVHEPARKADVALDERLGDGYRIPSYQDGGRRTTVPLKPAAITKAVGATLKRVEVYLAERMLLAVLDAGPALTFMITEPPAVGPGVSYRWKYERGEHLLSTGRQGEVKVRFRGFARDLEAFARLASVASVPAVVYPSAGNPPVPDGPASTEGEFAEPLRGDDNVFDKNAALAALYLDFLARYASVRVDRQRAVNGLTPEQVREITGHDQRAVTVTRYFTQGWKEFRGAFAGGDLGLFSVLEETVLTQWDRGNYTALHNLLEIGNAAEGIGLYRRGTIFRYYDENGEPVAAIGGGFRDSGYRAAAPPSAAAHIEITDRGLLQVFQSIRHVTLDEQIHIYQAAKGYADNRDLLWPEIRNGWDGWKAVNEELQRQLPVLVAFLAGHLVAAVLRKASDVRAKMVGETLEQMLRISGRIFHIVFAGELFDLALRCGRELSLVRREGGTALDALSQRHLATAAVHMRRLLTLVLAAGLTAAIVKTAESTAITLEPPKGGGPQLAPATGGAVRGGAGGSAAKPPSPGVALPPGLMREGDDGGGTSGGTDRNPEGRRETGAEKERRELREDRPSRPKGPTFYAYEGGQKGSFSQLVSGLRAHVAQLVGSGSPDPLPRLKDAERVLDQRTDEFIESRPTLKEIWDGMGKRLSHQLQGLDNEFRASAGDRPRARELLRRKEALEASQDELAKFGKGLIKDKRPDLVEFFLQSQRAEVTDITQRPLDDPFHNFKTLVYVEIIKALTGWNNVSGREYGSPTNQKVITDPSEGTK